MPCRCKCGAVAVAVVDVDSVTSLSRLWEMFRRKEMRDEPDQSAQREVEETTREQKNRDEPDEFKHKISKVLDFEVRVDATCHWRLRWFLEKAPAYPRTYDRHCAYSCLDLDSSVVIEPFARKGRNVLRSDTH